MTYLYEDTPPKASVSSHRLVTKPSTYRLWGRTFLHCSEECWVCRQVEQKAVRALLEGAPWRHLYCLRGSLEKGSLMWGLVHGSPAVANAHRQDGASSYLIFTNQGSTDAHLSR